MTTELLNQLTPPPAQSPERRFPGEPTMEMLHFHCDLSNGNSFVPERHVPPIPILSAFGAHPIHMCKKMGSWDLERAAVDHHDALIRSFRMDRPTGQGEGWEDVIFQFGERTFLCGDASRIVVYADTPSVAQETAREFTRTYGTEQKNPAGSFQLIRQVRFEIRCENVELDPDALLDDASLELHYPDGGASWHRDFVNRLIGSKHGLSILEGSPGTGKTSYLRHLMATLKDSHRFYFIPPSSLGILSKPDFIGFWASERHAYSDRRLVVILEDADAALMTRDTDNREQVSAILNLADGMLGDFLRLQIICTINCRSTDIDQALLRPGRLLCHRVFERLDPEQASRLANSLGKSLPQAQDYSLAEVFAGHEAKVLPRQHIGFGG